MMEGYIDYCQAQLSHSCQLQPPRSANSYFAPPPLCRHEKKAWTLGQCPQKFLRIAEVYGLWITLLVEGNIINIENILLDINYLAYLQPMLDTNSQNTNLTTTQPPLQAKQN